MPQSPLHIAFVWHMHQPYYRDRVTGACSMPWVRLHGSKDYLDMVQMLDEFPTIHQTFNLVPSLLEQLQEYLPPQNRSDTFLDVSRKPAAELSEEEKRFLLQHFFMANVERMIKPHPRYHDLLAKRGPEALKRFKPQDYLDLQVWFNLAWIDPWLRRRDADLARLEQKGAQFTEEEKQLVLEKQTALLRQIIPAYRAAQARGQVELTCSPYYHPIMPLLCDLRAAMAGMPQATLPEAPFRHPEDGAWQLAQGLAAHERLFGRKPSGLWPPEGGVSDELVRLSLEAGVRWIATDEEILWRTLKTAPSPSLRYRPHLLRREGKEAAIIFRDRELSDLIGFVYSQWEAQPAIRDCIRRLEAIAEQTAANPSSALVSIILDGENAWEHYPGDGQEFLQGLYRALANDARFRCVTVSEFLAQHPASGEASLPTLFPGSWIDGNFSTWIGHPEKNAAWMLLAQTRAMLEAQPDRAADRAGTILAGEEVPRAAERAALEDAWRNFYIAEGSDWMWWYGDTHSSAQDDEFDRLFRVHLMNVYRALGQPPPQELERPLRCARVLFAGSEPTAPISPRIDGLETTYYEWLYAGRVDLRKDGGAMHRGLQRLQMLWYGFDLSCTYFRLDLQRVEATAPAAWEIRFEFPESQLTLSIQQDPAGAIRATLNGQPQVVTPPEAVVETLACAYQRILEVRLPTARLGVHPGAPLLLAVSLHHDAQLVERYPARGACRLSVPAVDADAHVWSV